MLGAGLFGGAHGLAAPTLYACAVIAFLLSIFWRPRIGLYFLVPLLPLQTTRYKIIAYPLGNKLVFLIPLAVILGLLLRGRPLFPPGLPLKRFLIFFILFYFVSLWYGSFHENLPFPISSDDIRLENWINYMVMPVLYFLVAGAIEDMRQMKILILLMCLSLLIVDRGFFATMRSRDLSHFTSDDVRDAGPLGFAGENGLGAFESENALFLLALYSFARRKVVKLGLLALLAGDMYCLMFAFSRGGYAGFLAGFIFLGIFKERKFLVIVLALFIGWATFVPTSVVERITMTYNENGELESSSQKRLGLWEDASELIKANPVYGAGFDTYQFMHRDAWFLDTHNIYIKILVETGFVGLVLILSLLILSFRLGFHLFRSAQDPFMASVGLGFMAMIISVLVVNFFGDRWSYLQVNGYLWVLLACVVRCQMILRERDEKEDGERSYLADFPEVATQTMGA